MIFRNVRGQKDLDQIFYRVLPSAFELFLWHRHFNRDQWTGENGGLETSDISIFGDPCLSPQSQVVSLAAASRVRRARVPPYSLGGLA